MNMYPVKCFPKPGKSKLTILCVSLAKVPLNIELSTLTNAIRQKHKTAKEIKSNKRPIVHSGHSSFPSKESPLKFKCINPLY